MKKMLVRRLLQLIPLLLAVVVMNFALIQAAPGSFLDVMTAEQQVTDPAMIERLRETYGMDQPAYVQLGRYIWSVARLDFGFSYRQNAPVSEVIMAHLPATALLMVAAIGVAVLLGMLAGVLAAVKVNTAWDTMVSMLAVFCFAAPSFWLGIMLIVLFSVKLGWLPVGGMQSVLLDGGLWAQVLDIAKHLVLPTLALGLFYAATYARVMRASMLEVFRLDFVRTARAKGLGQMRVVLAHVLRNALLPIVTLLGLQLGTLLGGSVVIEAVFSWPGIGSLLFDSVMSRNFPVVLGVMVLSAVIVALANIAVDMVYIRLDPRIRIK
ncbi:ABC transporter permease [Shinella sp.]|uniref:ABC transporter permease n=1 Tax=Shinella sp. TaxID=1870904 RepID=UPI0039E58399